MTSDLISVGELLLLVTTRKWGKSKVLVMGKKAAEGGLCAPRDALSGVFFMRSFPTCREKRWKKIRFLTQITR